MTDLLTATRVGEILHLDRSTVTRMAADGRIPAVKIGRQWRFRAEDVRRLLDSPSTGDATASLPEERTERPGLPVRTRGGSRIPVDVATALAEVAATSLGVMMVVTDMDGQPLTPVLNPCPSFRDGASEPDTISRCAAEWRVLADDVELRPRFASGDLGFQCARAFVRSGRELVGMVLAGGVAAPDQDPTGLYELDDEARERVLDALPSVATALSRLVPTVDGAPPTTPARGEGR